MRLTRQSEIAVALLVRCASAPEITMRTDEVARSVGTTKDHAAQIVGQLVQAGFMKSTRGRNGGIKLAHDPENIRLGDVLQYVQPDLVFHMPRAKGLSIEEDCKTLREILAEAEATFLSVMDRYCVADLAEK